MDKVHRNLLGEYGPWIEQLIRAQAGEYSFLNSRWTEVGDWSRKARGLVETLLSPPKIGKLPVHVIRKSILDGVEVEELSW